MKRQFPVSIAVIIFLIILRIVFDGVEKSDLIVAGINVIAALLVFASITEQIKNNVTKKLERLNNPKEIIRREVKSKRRVISSAAYSSFTIIAAVYFIFFRSDLGNDIFSIISLGLAISDAHIAVWISNIIKL